VDFANLELAAGRDTLWWGPASQGNLVLSNNAPPLDLVKLSTPLPFRLPWIYSELGEWQVAYIMAYLGDAPPIPHSWLSALRITFQPATFFQFGFTNAFQAYGDGGVSVDALDFIPKNFVPSLDANEHTINGLVAYDIVLSLPWVRQYTFLHGAKFYWQRGQDNVWSVHGVLGGGNILGGMIDGGRWDLRLEFAETRDSGAVWYTHPTYQSGFAFDHFFLGHPMGGAAESFSARATYYVTPTMWLAADGRREQYGFAVQPHVTTQQRVGLEGSYELVLQQQHLVLWGRLEYATLDLPAAEPQHAFFLHLAVRWRL
jgi:Capsule assembly protein Wzi